MSSINAKSKDGNGITFGVDKAIGYFFDLVEEFGDPVISLSTKFDGLTKDGFLSQIQQNLPDSELERLKNEIESVVAEGENWSPLTYRERIKNQEIIRNLDKEFPQLLFITCLQHIEIKSDFPANIQIFPKLFISNDNNIIEHCLDENLIRNIGILETRKLQNTKVIIYGTYSEIAYKELQISLLQFLLKNLSFIRKFLSTSWLIKDNSVSYDSSFLEIPFKRPNADVIDSNFMSNIFTKASTEVETTQFTPEELKGIVKLQQTLYRFTFDEDEEDLQYFLQKGTPLIPRVFYFLEIARTTQDLGLKIAHYCTCYETLFSKESAELSHKLSERIANFLADSYDEKLAIYRDIKIAYNIRSKVVHGDQLPQKQINDLRNISEKSDFYLRLILNKIIRSKELITLFESKPERLEDYYTKLILGNKNL